MARRETGRTEQVWRERLRRYRGCGLTVAEFCAREGVSTASFYVWRRRLGLKPTPRRSGRSQSENGPPLFAPVSRKQGATTDMRIELPNGAVIRIPAEAEERLLRSCIPAATETGAGAVYAAANLAPLLHVREHPSPRCFRAGGNRERPQFARITTRIHPGAPFLLRPSLSAQRYVFEPPFTDAEEVNRSPFSALGDTSVIAEFSMFFEHDAWYSGG